MTKFSILIPTWNNLPFLKVCIKSILDNSAERHQIIVHVNDGSDGTLDWVKAHNDIVDFTYSPENIGVCLAMNTMRSKVRTDYMLFLNDDMYVLPGWDSVLADEIEAAPDNKFFFSSSLIQPHYRQLGGFLGDYGDTIQTFREKDLLETYKDFKGCDWLGATTPPNIVHRDIWDLVGGYSVELSPGMYSDPDFTAKLYYCGVRLFKGLSNSRVYHFETKTTTRIKKNDGTVQFLMKWGITNSVMRKYLTHKGEPADVVTPDGHIPLKGLIKSRIKTVYYALCRKWGPLYHSKS